jgi:alanyl-tRNA synthetase
MSEAISERQPPQQADEQPGDMQQHVQSLQGQLEEAQRTIEHLERRQKIDSLLAEAEPIDMEAVRLLTEQAVQQMDAPDVQTAVAELRQRRPYLFRQSTSAAGSAMAARMDEEAMPASERAAEEAASSGDRRDLLRYLRLRRNQ